MQSFSTPMMRQYMEIKQHYTDCLLFFRLGDFYELFLDDALLGARLLGITLTKRPRGKDGDIPMAGVPYHSSETYIARLIRAGHKVAICEQVSEPDSKSIVERAVVRIITPGTVLSETSLHDKEHNFVMALAVAKHMVGIAVADVSTGLCKVTAVQRDEDEVLSIGRELLRYHPSECIVSPKTYNTPATLKLISQHNTSFISAYKDWERAKKQAEAVICEHFNLSSVHTLGLEHHHETVEALAALIEYLDHTQQQKVTHLTVPQFYSPTDSLLLDPSTITNLEVFSTIRTHSVEGSLLGVLDQTVTAAGGRLLRRWLSEPLSQKKLIDQRLEAVDELVRQQLLRTALREDLKHVFDIERQLSKLALNIATPAAVMNIAESMKLFVEIRQKVSSLHADIWNDVSSLDSEKIQTFITMAENYLEETESEDASAVYTIKHGVNQQLDEVRDLVAQSEQWLQEYEQQLRTESGIQSLKCKSNSVFGYYIEVSNANLSAVPQYFVRKQTLVNAERFTTRELKDHEEKILQAQQQHDSLILEVFNSLVKEVLTYAPLIKQVALQLAQLDVITAFAHLAQQRNYCKPAITSKDRLQISAGRHPVVERLVGEKFVPNDVTLDRDHQQLLVITGPNMAGKSVYMRQVASIVLMAHLGSFVPADQATIPLTDRIFVRSGASDSISDGLSTFMVEMVETAHILHHATAHSLVIMDEIGRGTSTYDGISIAWAIAEFLLSEQSQRPKVLFATHYHELQALADKYPDKVKNYQVAVEKHRGKPLFLYTMIPGRSSHSFGVAVAQLAGLPQPVIKRAEDMLKTLEAQRRSPTHNSSNDSTSQLSAQLQSIKVDTITPIEALNMLAQMKSQFLNDKNT